MFGLYSSTRMKLHEEMYSLAFISLSVFLVPNLALEVTKKSISTWNAHSLNHTNCGERGTYFHQQICLEDGSHRTVPPDLTKTQVNIFIYLIRVNEVDDNKRILAFEIMLGEIWFDPRIKANFSEFELFKDIEKSDVGESIWTPTIRLRKIRNRKGFWDAFDDRLFRLSRNDELGGNSFFVERGTRGRVSVYCDPWNLETYPLDNQFCELTFDTIAPHSIRFIVSPLIDRKRTYNEDGFQISTTLIPGKHDDNFTIFLEFERKLQPFFISGYLPSMAIVCLSGSSFLLPTNPLPARIGLGVTNFLTLTNLLIHETVSFVYAIRPFQFDC